MPCSLIEKQTDTILCYAGVHLPTGYSSACYILHAGSPAMLESELAVTKPEVAHTLTSTLFCSSLHKRAAFLSSILHSNLSWTCCQTPTRIENLYLASVHSWIHSTSGGCGSNVISWDDSIVHLHLAYG
jgi:hypothetical protein